MPYLEASVRSKQLIAAARTVLARDGVANVSLRAIAAEGGVSLGTLQYVFPSKEKLLRAVIDDVVAEIADVLKASLQTDGGLAEMIRHAVQLFWTALVADETNQQLMQLELLNYALRTPGQEDQARWQYDSYVGVLAQWSREAAQRAGETTGIPYDRLARVMLGSIDGLIVQYICNPQPDRAREDLDTLAEMLIAHAQIRPAS